MPRPKPDEEIKPHEVRLTDSQWKKLKELGGAAWLRRFLGGKPDKYHEVFRRPSRSAADNEQLVAFRSSGRSDFAADAPVNRETND